VVTDLEKRLGDAWETHQQEGERKSSRKRSSPSTYTCTPTTPTNNKTTNKTPKSKKKRIKNNSPSTPTTTAATIKTEATPTPTTTNTPGKQSARELMEEVRRLRESEKNALIEVAKWQAKCVALEEVVKEKSADIAWYRSKL
jgi:hypothetical protein